MTIDEGNIVRRGRYRYGDTTVRVIVVRSNTRPGSGDYEDPPEIRDDLKGEFYDLHYGAAGSPDDILNNGVRGFETLEDAIRHMDKFGAEMIWDD